MQGNSHWPCLVVSHDEGLRREFAAAAKQVGWQPWVTHDSVNALKILCRTPVKLALLHLPSDDTALGNMRQLVEHMAWIGGVLLIVGAAQSDPRLETWARETGVWTYLPEIDAQADFAGLCEQAYQIVGKHQLTHVS